MIEIGKKYRLKKLKGWFEKDSDEFTVVCFGEHNIVDCVAPNGEKYVFDKDYTPYRQKLQQKREKRTEKCKTWYVFSA